MKESWTVEPICIKVGDKETLYAKGMAAGRGGNEGMNGMLHV
jgi:hypothetical protein